MKGGEVLSLLINIAVGLYFAHFYPRSLKRRFPVGRMPPLFVRLGAILPPLGIALIIGSICYAVLIWSGVLE